MPQLEVQVLRGSTIESRHQIAACVVDQQGNVKDQFGDREILIFPRSAIKPLQALLLVESGAYKAYGLTSMHLAIACSSHKCEKFHLDLVRSWMQKMELTENDLICGGHWPGHIPTAHQMIREGREPTPICNNCSGKHTGLLTVCRHMGWPVKDYGSWDHPLQQAIRKKLSTLAGKNLDKGPWGIDGCGIPTLALPLSRLAQAMSHLHSTDDEAAQQVVRAMQTHPELVGGSEDFTSDVIAQSQGQALIKTGAEGVYAGIIFPGKLAFAVKALDGQSRASEAATAYVLQKWKGLASWQLPPVTNWKGLEVGSLRVVES